MSIDRLERRLPEVLTDLSLPVMPDYIDTLLSRTERMPQRPGWTFPERWFPVSTITSALAPRRPISLRPLIVLAVVAALIAGALAIYVGSQQQLPPPFGLARNGLITTASAAGDIVLLDPKDGSTRTIVAGPNLCCSAFSPNGRYVDYLRLPPGQPDGEPTALVIADMHGATIAEVPGSNLVGLSHGEWAPTSDKELLTTAEGGIIVEVPSGNVTSVNAPGRIMQASWIGVTGDILLTYLVNVDNGPGYSYQTLRVARLEAGETAPTTVTEIQYAVGAPLVSPDGSKFLYFIWGPEERLHGRVHVFDFASKRDIAITSEDANEPEHNVEDPHWSPDGARIAAAWFFAGYDQVGITDAVSGATTFIGPKFPGGFPQGTLMQFTPDGESLLLRGDDVTWLLPVDGSPGQQVPWHLEPEWGWQRLAP